MARFGIFALVVFGSLCSLNTNLLADPASPTPVLILMGGFKSCPEGGEILQIGAAKLPRLREALTPVSAQFERGHRVRPVILQSCYTGFQDGLSLSRIELRFSKREDFSDYSTISFSPQSLRGPAFLQPLFNEIDAALAAVANPKVYLYGHSYGGWTAMQTALHLQGRATLAGLTTIDPISPVQCKANEMVVETITGIFTPPEACRRAPSDIASPVLVALGRGLPWWLHYYQTQFRLLHSSDIGAVSAMNLPGQPQRGFSLRVTRPSPDPVLNNHHSLIGFDAQIWETIRRFTLETF